MSSQNQEWQVERIIQRANDKGIIKYKVLWQGFPPQEATWEPIEHLEHCKEAIYEFENNLKKLQSHKGSKKNNKEAVDLHDAGQEEENGSQSKFKQQEERISINQEEEPKVPSEKDEDASEKEEEVPAEPQAQKADEAAKEAIAKQEAESAGKPQNPPIDEALNTKKREFEPSESEIPQAGKMGKKIKKVEFEVKQEFINPTIIEGNNLPKATLNDQSRKRNQSFDPNSLKKPERLTKNPSDHKDSESKSSKEKKYRLFTRQLSRYAFCDKEFQAQQKNTLSNIMRKIAGQQRVKSKPIFIDISKTSDLIQVFEGLHEVNCESHLSTLDLLVRVDYGWVAIGRSEGRYIIVDVNLIEEQSWQVFVDWLKKKERSD